MLPNLADDVARLFEHKAKQLLEENA